MSEAHRLHVANAVDKTFDGDVCSMNSVFVQESLDEVKKLFDIKDVPKDPAIV